MSARWRRVAGSIVSAVGLVASYGAVGSSVDAQRSASHPSSCAIVVSFGVQFTSISAPSDNDVWVAAPGSEPVAAAIGHWNGRRWRFWCGGRSHVWDISATSSSNTWTVGYDLVDGAASQQLMRWNGRGWAPVTNLPILERDPRSVLTLSPNDTWVTGFGVEQWNGTRWRVERYGGGRGEYGPIAATSSTDAWAVWQAYAHGSVKSAVYHLNHETWTKYSAVNGELKPLGIVRALAAISSTDVWAGGRGFERWNGKRWVRVPSPRVDGILPDVSDVTVSSKDSLWAIASTSEGKLMEHWNGRRWTIRSLSRSNGLHGDPAVTLTARGHPWFAGWKSVSTWTGTSWRNILPRVAEVFGGVLNSVAAIAGDVWMAGRYYRNGTGDGPYPLVEHWHGLSGTITPVPPRPKYGWLTSISGCSPSDVWAVGTSFAGRNQSSPSGLIEYWNGRNWTVVPGGSVERHTQLGPVAAISPTDAWLIAGSGFEQWNGRRWNMVPGAVSRDVYHALSGIAAISKDDVWAVGSRDFTHGSIPNGPLIEHWNGKSWSVVPAHDTYNRYGGGFSAVTAINSHDVWAVGGNYYGMGSGTLVEHWDGKVWSVSPGSYTGGDKWYLDVHAASRNDLWAVGEEYAPYRPSIDHWNGRGWGIVHTPFISGNNILTAIAVRSKRDAWAVGGEAYSNTLEPIPIEHWNGKRWEMVTGPVP